MSASSSSGITTPSDVLLAIPSTKLNTKLLGSTTSETAFLTRDRVVWGSSVDSPTAAVVMISNIKEISVSPKAPKLKLTTEKPTNRGTDFIFTFNTMAQRDSFRDTIAQLMGELKRQQQQQQPLDASVIPEEVRHQAAILARDPELKKLYDELVGSGIITDEMFWSQRKHLLQTEASRTTNQSVGLKNMALTGFLQPTEESANTVKFTLNSTIIQQIFAEYPGVKRAYHDKVPTQMQESEFWTRFFQSQYFHGRSRSILTSRQQDFFVQYQQEEEKEAEKAPKAVAVERDVNLMAEETPLQGYGVVKDSAMMPSKLRGASNLIKQFNRHSDVVLAGLSKDSSRHHALTTEEVAQKTFDDDSMRKHIILDDLLPDQGPQLIPLNIQDQHAYFEAPPEVAAAAAATAETKKEVSPALLLQHFKNEVLGATYQASKAHIPSSVAIKIMAEVNHQAKVSSHNTLHMLEGIPQVPAEFRKELTDYFNRVTELLRHFWSLIPIGQKPDKEEKVKNIVAVISTTYDAISARKETMPMEQRSELNPLLNPLLECLNKAIMQYNEEKQILERIRRGVPAAAGGAPSPLAARPPAPAAAAAAGQRPPQPTPPQPLQQQQQQQQPPPPPPPKLAVPLGATAAAQQQPVKKPATGKIQFSLQKKKPATPAGGVPRGAGAGSGIFGYANESVEDSDGGSDEAAASGKSNKRSAAALLGEDEDSTTTTTTTAAAAAATTGGRAPKTMRQ